MPEPLSVPLADEVRAARADLRRAELAAIELAHIQVGLTRVSRGLPPDPEWAAGFPIRWPDLAVVPTDRAMLLAIRGALTPVARSLPASANRLHHLQHEQRAALSAADLAPLRAELDQQLAALHTLDLRRTGPMQRAAALGPVLAVVSRALGPDTAAADPERAGPLAEALTASAAQILGVLGIDAALPDPAEPGAIASLHRTLGALYAQAEAESAETSAAWDALNDRLLERMG